MDQPARSPSESRDRAVSSEPCSTRPNPFDDDGSSARKRRRTSLNGASPSRSIDTPPESSRIETQGWPGERDASMTMDSASSVPQTPERQQDETQPASDTKPTKITLNLKNRKHTPDSDPPSPSSQDGVDTELVGMQENGIRASVEDSELDVAHASPDYADTASSTLDLDNLPIEIVDDDEEDQVVGSHVTLLQDTNPMVSFPFQPNEPLVESLPKLCQLLPTNGQALNLLRTWIDEYVVWASDKDPLELLELYTEYREFWQIMPMGVWQHSSPSRHVPRNQQLFALVYETHTSFARLAATFVDLDRALMKDNTSGEPWQDLTSTGFVHYLWLLLLDYASLSVPSMGILEVESFWPEPLVRMLEGFRCPYPTAMSQPPVHPLYSLGFSLTGLVHRLPRLLEHLPVIIQLASFLARHEFARLHSSAFADGSEQAKSALAHGYRLYDAVSRALAACIEKSVNQIAPHVATELINGLTDLLRICLRAGCDSTQNMIKGHQQAHLDIAPTDTVKVIVAEWRLATLTKLIMSSQMQLRINAAQVMCTDLVRIWKDNHEQAIDLSQQPVLRHFSDQLLQSGVVAYVLGPTCHPEVTAQSSNIIGFLFASHTFTDELMDYMWRTVTTCQISGVSESLLTTVALIANLFSPNDFLSVFRRLQTVPIENFTPTMKDFCERVVLQLIEKNDSIDDLLPYSLMFRLLRESSAPGPQSYQTIHKWASNLIFQLLRRGPSAEDRQSLQQECLMDIAEKSPFTLGSLHALLLLCRPVSRERDLQQLTAQYNLPQLLVDELEHAINSRADTGILHAISGPENSPRLELLTSVIFYARDGNAIAEDLGRRLWELLVGQRAASQEDRDCAWHNLSNAMKTVPENPFLDTCFKEYFPTLPPELFCPGSLDFILQKILPLINRENSFVLEDDESSEHLAIEQLWRIALTALSGTIEQRAITSLVKDVYMENNSIERMPLHRARKLHLALVSRCMRQLSSATKQLTATSGEIKENNSDDMIVIADDQATPEQELMFTRSLTIVREFHKLHQQTPRFSSPDMRSLVLPENNDVEGEPAELKYQSFDGDAQTDVRPLAIGRQNTAGSLLASIRDATGFDNYRMYYKGRPFTPSEQDICKSLDDLQIHNGLILVKRETDEDEYPVHVRPGASPVEIEIMKHFEELWQYLALEEKLASEIYAFLITLPVDEQILNLLRKDTTTYRDVFPIGHPLKSLYALHAIREDLSAQYASAKSQEERDCYCDTLRRASELVVSAISDREVVDSGSGADLKAVLATRLVEQLLMILRDPMRSPSVSEHLDHVLMDRLSGILSTALATEPNVFNTNLVTVTFRAIMDACSLKRELWDWLVAKMNIREAVQKLLIDDPRDVVRRLTVTTIGDKITHSLSSSTVSPTAFRNLFWPLLMDLVPRALARPSLETFNLAVMICKESDTYGHELQRTVQYLSNLLLDCSPLEIPGMALALPRRLAGEPFPCQNLQPGTIDLGVHGLVNLLHRLMCHKDGANIAEQLPSGLGLDLFRRLLFTRCWTSTDLLWPGGLIYNETTRMRLNDIVLRLVGRDLAQVKDFFEYLDDLVPCREDDELDTVPQYLYDLPVGGFDRSKEIRAACGYAGLRNLSNTCYLNSLCTQLFMNVDFRRFILSVEVDREDPSQALLLATQSMFAQLQSSYRRFVDPEDFVTSIKTYDDEMINIHNQMDVEEFFNLLNDRWEGQLRSQEAVRRFRLFYNGQLVTQTKSKECDHISEVMEPFSAIQCDIKGKSNLLESLEAYVDGEHMEGDNKYKCSSCDRHVDAVRRSCLKEIPDSLIFHLKRFDFNLRTQSRSKINDYFAFPDRINMRPYTVEHLSNSPGASSEDWFELVGVLVHAGTAESGHYYSFIRERPTSRQDESWFEFNDDVVSPWHPSKLEACCFGGTESSWDAGGVTYEKNYCAYMLFYERSSTLEKKQQDVQRANIPSPVQARLSVSLAPCIRADNMQILQRHCLFDPDHMRLVNDAIERILDLNDGECSEDHETENVVVRTAISHLDQVASRAKDVPDAQNLADRIKELADNCPKCAFAIYKYFSTRHHAFRNLVQRNPEVGVRRSAVAMFNAALCSIKESNLLTANSQEDVLHNVCGLFETIWEFFHLLRFHRSWPEVFDMMARFVESGKDELLAFLNHDFLRKTMLIFLAPFLHEHRRDQQFTNLVNILARRPNRSPCYKSAIELLRSILTQVSMATPVRSFPHREKMHMNHPDEPLRLTGQEYDLLTLTLQIGGNALFDRIISINQNAEATDEMVAHILEQQWPLEYELLETLVVNTKPQSGSFVYAPYLQAAATFCRLSYNSENIDRLISNVAQYSKALAASEPRAIWGFFKGVIDGPRQHSGESKNEVQMQCLKYLPLWAPVLLAQYDPNLSHQVETVLNENIFQFGADSEIEDQYGGQERAEAIALCARRIGNQSCDYVHEAIIRRGQVVSTATVAVLQRVLTQCGAYFDTSEETPNAETQRYNRTSQVIMDNLRRLSVDDLEDDGSDWENSVASSEQIESLADDEMRDMDI